MIATILKSKQAIEATFAIIETFLKIRELSRSVRDLSVMQDQVQQMMCYLNPDLTKPKTVAGHMKLDTLNYVDGLIITVGWALPTISGAARPAFGTGSSGLGKR